MSLFKTKYLFETSRLIECNTKLKLPVAVAAEVESVDDIVVVVVGVVSCCLVHLKGVLPWCLVCKQPCAKVVVAF